MRVVVVEPPPAGVPRLASSRLSVGAFDWADPDPVATVVVKLAFTWAGHRGDPAEMAELSLAAPPALHALDLVPYKPLADVLVSGHAHARGAPAREIPVRFTVGPLAREVVALASAPVEKIPLLPGAVFTPDAEHDEQIGPSPVPLDLHLRSLPDDFDYAVFNAAPPAQRREPFALGEVVTLSGLSARGDVRFELPRRGPRVRVSFRGTLPDVELQMEADTMLVDSDREIVVLTYRGMIGTPRAKSVASLAVSVEDEGSGRPWAIILRSGARGAFSISGDHRDMAERPRDDEERAQVEATRADLVMGQVAAEPTLSLDAYVRLAAELAERRAPRADVLAGAGFDELLWAVEERAWLERMAAEAAAGDGTLAAEYGERWEAAQEALADPGEARRTAADWAEITAALEVAEEPGKELDRREITLAAWMRLDRRVSREAAESDEAAAEIERLLADARERAVPRARDEGEEDGPGAALAALRGDDDGGDA